MTPFGLFLQDLRREKNLAQKQLAGMLGIDQSYLSGLESGRKGAPPPAVVLRLRDALSLNERDAIGLQHAAEQSRRKLEIPIAAAPSEYALVHFMFGKLGHLRPGQVRAIQEILSLNVVEG
ncbi:MAG: DNA-binding protein [Planctomycetaceae bacterium]|nr:DNA-binding protein [Planctomycetaceae bacterium]